MSDDIRMRVARGCAILAENGHSDMVWGHLSVRDPHGRGVWIKRAGLGFDEVSEDDIHLVSWDAELLEGAGPVHIEAFIHIEIMRVRLDVESVVHSHPESAVVLAATGLPLLPIGHEATFFAPLDVARFTETGDLIHTAHLGASVARSLADRNAILLVNHGVVVAERSIDRAVFGAILLEKAARMTLAAYSATHESFRDIHVASDDEVVAKRDRCYSDKQVGLGWDYLNRRIDKKIGAPVD